MNDTHQTIKTQQPGNMAFIDIQDPVKREEIVQDYIKNIREIQEKKENQKLHGMTVQQNIEKVFQPVVKATEKSASQITSEIKNLKEKPKNKPISSALNYYLNELDKSKVDKYFGIYEKDGVYMMGNKVITVDEYDNIRVDNTSFKGSRGLWRLIMMKKPELFEDEDLRDYKELIDRTDAIEFPHKVDSSNRPRNTTKYTFLMENFGVLESDKKDNEESDKGEESEESDEEKENKDGTGIHFLPGDINGLINQLHLLLAEFRAGNKSATKNQIVAILDELLKRNYLNQDEYNGVCRTILC